MKKINGFQLMELILSVSIISILISLSVPLYSQHLTQARRFEAESLLSKLAIAMEEYHFSYHTYQDATLTALNFPEFVAKDHYQLKIEFAHDNEYLLIAKPMGPQAEKDIACASLTLHSNGEKGIRGTGKIDECW